MKKAKVKNRKDQLFHRLSDANWSIIEKKNQSEWWIFETWIVRSDICQSGLIVFLTLELDPMCETPSHIDNVWRITASLMMRTERLDKDFIIADAIVRKGKLGPALKKFIRELDNYRWKNN